MLGEQMLVEPSGENETNVNETKFRDAPAAYAVPNSRSSELQRIREKAAARTIQKGYRSRSSNPTDATGPAAPGKSIIGPDSDSEFQSSPAPPPYSRPGPRPSEIFRLRHKNAAKKIQLVWRPVIVDRPTSPRQALEAGDGTNYKEVVFQIAGAGHGHVHRS